VVAVETAADIVEKHEVRITNPVRNPVRVTKAGKVVKRADMVGKTRSEYHSSSVTCFFGVLKIP